MEKRITFTPGPWYVSLTPDRDEEGWVGPEVYDRDLGVFAVLDGEPETIAQPWSEADARLIAAAPDLLAATEAWVAAMKGWLDGNPPKSPEESRAIYDAAVAALKKARGEA